ncbi:hypothetical protein TorRG33x02_108270, partial [Trema orientale]
STNYVLLSLSVATISLSKLPRSPTVDKHWIPPATGCLKLNIAIVSNGVNSASFRPMIWDHLGDVVFFAASYFPIVSSTT